MNYWRIGTGKRRRSVVPLLRHSTTPLLHAATLLALAALPACGEKSPPPPGETLYAFEEPHMGTLFRIKLYADSEHRAREAATAAFDRIEALDETLSDYIPDSELNRLSSAEALKPVVISADLHSVLADGLAIARQTGGAFDPTVGHYTNLWRRAVRKGKLPTPEQLAVVGTRSGFDKLILDGSREEPPLTATLQASGMKLDLGGIAKGFAADAALARLREHGVTRAAVAAGGDIRVGGAPPEEKGWEIPVLAMDRGTETYTAKVLLENTAISTSGDREQFVEIGGVEYSHIVDPRTGLGLTFRITATVIAPRAVLADSLATALCILGPDEGIALIEDMRGIEALVITTDRDGNESRHATNDFPE